MGKNVHGGSGHKKFARKHSSGGGNQSLRISKQDDEVYSVVTKMLGNNMFHCIGIDSVPRLGRIRGKFTGRGKRDNFVTAGAWVLVGLREWGNEDDNGTSVASTKKNTKMKECDLMEVYSDMDKVRLTDSINLDWSVLTSNDTTKAMLGTVDADQAFAFATDTDIARARIADELKSDITTKISLNPVNEHEESNDIDIDDI